MTPPQNSDFSASLCHQLELAGPPAIAMLTGRAPPDFMVLLTAMQAAGLLDETTAGTPDLRRLRRELIQAAKNSGVLLSAVEALEPASCFQEITELSPDEQEEALHRIVALAGVAEVGPAEVQRLIDPALSYVEAAAVMEPEGLLGLARIAGWISDQLDLAEGHRATRLLRHIAETPELAAIEFDEAEVRQVIAGLSSTMGHSMLWEWAEKLGDFARNLAVRLREVDGVLCASQEEQPRSEVFPERIRLHHDHLEEVSLCLHAGEMLLEWMGPPELCPTRAELTPEGGDLKQEPETFVAGTVLWSFDWPPPGDVRAVALHRDGGPLLVPLEIPRTGNEQAEDEQS
jgi:hypothetical protein